IGRMLLLRRDLTRVGRRAVGSDLRVVLRSRRGFARLRRGVVARLMVAWDARRRLAPVRGLGTGRDLALACGVLGRSGGRARVAVVGARRLRVVSAIRGLGINRLGICGLGICRHGIGGLAINGLGIGGLAIGGIGIDGI